MPFLARPSLCPGADRCSRFLSFCFSFPLPLLRRCGRVCSGAGFRGLSTLGRQRTAYYVAFGPHGPRAPITPAGTTPKIIFGMTVILAATSLVFFGVRSQGAFTSSLPGLTLLTGFPLLLWSLCVPIPVSPAVRNYVCTAPPPPRTITKEWEEASNVRAKEMNINPIHGQSRLHSVMHQRSVHSLLGGRQVSRRRVTLARAT